MSGSCLESALVPARRRIAAVLAVLAVGVAPGAAFAQSGGAGDDQYIDPIGGNSQQQNSGNSGNSNGSSGSSSNGSTGPALSNSPALSAQASPSTAAAPAASSGQELPRTGLDAGLVAAAGLTLLLAGAALRRRLRDERL